MERIVPLSLEILFPSSLQMELGAWIDPLADYAIKNRLERDFLIDSTDEDSIILKQVWDKTIWMDSEIKVINRWNKKKFDITFKIWDINDIQLWEWVIVDSNTWEKIFTVPENSSYLQNYFCTICEKNRSEQWEYMLIQYDLLVHNKWNYSNRGVILGLIANVFPESKSVKSDYIFSNWELRDVRDNLSALKVKWKFRQWSWFDLLDRWAQVRNDIWLEVKLTWEWLRNDLEDINRNGLSNMFIWWYESKAELTFGGATTTADIDLDTFVYSMKNNFILSQIDSISYDTWKNNTNSYLFWTTFWIDSRYNSWEIV